MTVRKVMIIRHGEKPPKAGPPPRGVDLAGAHSADQLTPRGWQRAGALVSFFAPLDGRAPALPIERPTAVFAAGTSEQSSSLRPQSTVAPLVLALTTAGTAVPSTVLPGPGHEAAAARSILDTGSEVCLVCWEHKRIGDLVSAITTGLLHSPHWDGSRFDGVFVLTLAAGHWTLAEVPQRLLAGDLAASVSLPAPGVEPDDE